MHEDKETADFLDFLILSVVPFERDLISRRVKSIDELNCEINLNVGIDLLITDVKHCDEASLNVKSENKNCKIIIVANENVKVHDYVNVNTTPSAILIKPFVKKLVLSELKTVCESIENERSRNDDFFVIACKSEVRRIHYGAIFYFESDNKKINIYTKNSVTNFYGALKDLGKRLPDRFLRIHKSYIVNSDTIDSFCTKENELVLTNGTRLKVSRSFLKSVKTLIEKIQCQ